MAKKKSLQASTPRRKRMRRDQRLQSARAWLPTYAGKNIVRGYKNHFGVDEVCALVELRALGRQIDEKRIERARLGAQRRGEANLHRRETRQEIFNPYPDSDYHHYYVAGYTAGGFAYGITWEEAEAAGYLEADDMHEVQKPLPDRAEAP